MKVLLRSQVSDLSHVSAPVSPQKSPAGLLTDVSNASQRSVRCVKTARRSACQSLCETSARCPLHKVPRFLLRGAHISDVFLFLRREERGRGVSVPQDGQGVFLERDPAEDSGWHLPFRGHTPRLRSTCRAHTAPRMIATHERTQYVTMCPWAQTCISAPPNSSCSKIPRRKGSCLRADLLLECSSLPENYTFLIL